MKFVKRSLSLIISTIVIFLITITYLYIWISYYNSLLRYSPFYNNGIILLTLVYAVLYVLLTNLYNGFKIGHLRITDIVYSQATALVIVNSITYLEVSLMDRRLLNPGMFIVMTLVQFTLIVIWAYVSNRIYFKIFKPLKILVLYEQSKPDLFIAKVMRRDDKFDVQTVKHVYTLNPEVESVINDHDTIMLFDVSSGLRNDILKYCYEKQIPAYLTPKISDIIVGSSEWIHLFDTPLFLSKNTNVSLEQAIIKRFFDIVLSLTLIILTSPILILFSIIIKLNDRGPVFYVQQRLTLNNRVFKIYKFRSMIIDAEKNQAPQLAKKDDQRITSVGKFMRKTRIDELPQLINIFKGDMSFVGPRPERPELVEKYLVDFPEFGYRTRVKAGLTGYAQIMGKYNTSIYDKLKLDLMYIENYSLLLDLKILLATIKYVITPANEESSEGFDV